MLLSHNSATLRVDPRVTDGSALASIEAARDALRAGFGKGKPRFVDLAATDHALARPFELTAMDSGTPDAPITYRTAPDELPKRARIHGGVVIPNSAFKPCKVPSGVGGVFVADLSGLVNASSFGALANPYPKALMRVYYNGTPAVLARDPNVRGTTPGAPWEYAGYDRVKVVSPTVLALNDSATGARWHAAAAAPHANVWLHGFFDYDWRDTFIRVKSVEPPSGGNSGGGGAYLITRDDATPPQYPFRDGCRFLAVNALELLDAPGEYFIDTTAKRLYFSAGSDVLHGEVSVSVLSSVLRSDGANHTAFANLSLTTAQEDVVSISRALEVHVVNCTVSNAGTSCLSLSGTNSSVSSSTIRDCGGAGVGIAGGHKATLTAGNVRAVGNDISSFALERRTYNPGVAFTGVGLYVANNSIRDGPHTGITGGGLLNTFEHNELKHLCFGSIDVGAFYTGRSWAHRGNVARYNTFDTIRATERLAQKSNSQNAFYLDDQMSGWEFYGNTIRNATTGVLLGGGRRNKIHANRFIACDRDIAFDNRGMREHAHSWHEGCQRNCSATMGNVTTSCLYNALRDINYTFPPFATRFPEVVDIYDNHPCVPVGNVIEDNVYCHAESPGGGGFINQADDVVTKWLSTISNNREDCSTPPQRGSIAHPGDTHAPRR